MTDNNTYINDQLQRLLNLNSPDAMQIKITGDRAESKVLNLSIDNIGAIEEFLKLLRQAQSTEVAADV